MFRFIDEQGREISLPGTHEWVAAIREGRIQPSTLVFEATESRWRPAREMEAFRVAVAAMGGPHQGPVEPPLAPPVEKHDQVAPTPVRTAPKDDLHPKAEMAAERPMDPAAPRKHGWQGVLYYWLSYAGAGVGALASVILIPAMLIDGAHPAVIFFAFIFMAGLSAFSFFLARGIQRFKPWARVAALFLSYLAVLGGLMSIFGGAGAAEVLGGIMGTVLYIIFIVYFHTARDLFTRPSRPNDTGGPQGSTSRRVLDLFTRPSRPNDTGARPAPISAPPPPPSPSRASPAAVHGEPNSEGTGEDGATVRVRCRQCGNAEDIPTSKRYNFRVYQKFNVKERFFGGWTLLCLSCEHKVPYDPSGMRARTGA